MLELARKHKERFLYLEALYKLATGSPVQSVHHDCVATRANLGTLNARDAFDYLLHEGLIKAQNYQGAVSITHQGVKEYETTLLGLPNDLLSTRGKSITNIVQISGQVSENQINFGNNVETIGLDLDTQRREILELVGFLKETLPEMKLDTAAKSTISAEIDTIEQELQTEEPRKSLIQGAFRNLKAALTTSIFDTSLRFILSRLTKLD